MNSGDALHCSLYRIVKTGKYRGKYSRRRRMTRKRASYPTRRRCLAGG